jgi:hypothetical protein
MNRPLSAVTFRPNWILAACAMFVAGNACDALDPARNLEQYNCRTWRRDNGYQRIRSTRSRWTATACYGGDNLGLARFDGMEFTSPNRA